MPSQTLEGAAGCIFRCSGIDYLVVEVESFFSSFGRQLSLSLSLGRSRTSARVATRDR